MSLTAASLIASSRRSLGMRMRPDLEVRPARGEGRMFYVVKDPVALRYFRFAEEEFAVLEMLDGVSSLESIKKRYDRRFAPERISLEELSRLVGMLHSSSLILSDAAGQWDQLEDRRKTQARKQTLAALLNVLCIRFRGFDPQQFLEWLYARMKWAFHPLALFTACLLILSSLALVAVRFDEFYAKLPTFHQFFAAENWVYLALVVAGTKVLHELGHALVCRHFGGKCHEMGVMLMMFAPCLYCNVSDAWMFPSRWRRAAVGAGGMAVELMLAALASFVWWFSAPGIINSLALQVMFVCSVSTLLINANPLLRFDGYYILADLIDIPNLRQKAEGLLRKTLGQWLLGLEAPPDPMLPQTRRGFLIGFAIAAATYRWIVTFSIFWFLYRVLEPYGLKLFGQLLAIMAVSSLLITPLVRMIKFFLVPGRTDKVNRLRAAISLGITLAALAGIALIPLPYYVECAVEIEPYHARSVYVDVAGTLDSLHVKPGQQVTANQALADLSDIDQRLALAKLEGERSELAARLAWLRQREITDDEAGMEVGNVQESLTAVEQQLDKRKQYVKRLNVVAPVSGYVLPPQAVDAPADDKVKLAVWWGTPLETRNIGAHLQEGVLLCRIGDPRQLQAVVAVDQSDIDFVRPGQTVSIKLDQFPGRVYRGTIDQISKSDVQATSAGMSSQHGGRLATKTDAQGRAKPLSTTYSADVPLGLDDEGVLTIGARGRAKIHAGYRTLGSRLWRTLAQTFNFRL